ncbi:prepilin-type N-terminal cleavage/methylation domain-containing protein [Marichromatium sp. AB31]|uniref:prepilin-type N-terminal cleavage/methylation domain-containing protein n=1 Tax=Marichromatium sp. AB31 TaxID=2483362 RepID=UPI0016806965|nr:prepilin-type N-terminal cleavage/methylation domain-containing protein [Marichromatium sp. AB31]
MKEPLTPLRSSKGFTLVELMIAMLLGLVVTGGTISALIANRQSQRTIEALAETIENQRTAFELLSRDIRQAGSTGCGNERISSVLNTSPEWWATWRPIQGYQGDEAASAIDFSSSNGGRVNGTDALQLQSIRDNGFAVSTHDVDNARITIDPASTDIDAGEILIVCDNDHATLFQANTYNQSSGIIGYSDTGGTPGNCTTGLDHPHACKPAAAKNHQFPKNASVSRLNATFWYIGNNGRATEGGRGLYRAMLEVGSSGTPTSSATEIIPGVTDMQLRYRLSGSDQFVDTTTNWNEVNAVEITLTFASTAQNISVDASATDGRIIRQQTYLVSLRNRAQ